ncbi:MAG: cupin-like domain-containing protein [Myxococcales bacterium]|nr:cupin-like domain-containing protein [Myxococcales bacterium]
MPPDHDHDHYIGLADPWRHFVVRALAGGAAPAAVVDRLVAQGVPRALAVHEVDVIAVSSEALGTLVRRQRMVLDMLEHLAPSYVARRPLCGAQEFYDRYFTASRPVVFLDGCARMAARRWTFDDLRARFGQATVEIGARDPVTMRLRDALDRMEQPDAPPELYLVSRNQALAGPLRALTDELAPLPEFLDGDQARRTASLWLGPRGTLSPLHHDTTHVYFCQLHGTKQYELVAPWQAEVLAAPIEGSDSGFDLDHPGDVRVHRLVLHPGEALLVPVGWWHRVRALSPSISVSLRAFVWPAGLPWYLPGSPGATAVGP